MVDMLQYVNSPFLKVEHLREGTRKLKIAAIKAGNYNQQVLEFEDTDDQLALNVTNVKTLIAVFGRNSDDWIGKEIELYLGETIYEGKPRESVLVRAVSPAIPFKDRTPSPKTEEPPPFNPYGDDQPPF